MRPIDILQCVQLGYIIKPHGLQGHLTVKFDEGYDYTLEEAEFVFLKIEGGLVPFHMEEEVRFRSQESAIIKFEELTASEKAKEFIGCEVYVFKEDVIEPENISNASLLEDYRVIDSVHGDIGVVTKVNNFSGNRVLSVEYRSVEIMIPLSEEVLQEIDEENQILYVTCPEGLIDMFLES